MPLLRFINKGNDSSVANTYTDIQSITLAKIRKDIIRRKILAILNLDVPTTTVKPPIPKNSTPDNPILSEPSGRSSPYSLCFLLCIFNDKWLKYS